jgi:hypothetical protein
MFHRRRTPLLASMACIPLDTSPLILAKLPPAMTLVRSPVTVSARTASSAAGAQLVRAPPDTVTAASRGRDTPLTVVNEPPAYTLLPATVSAKTVLLKLGRLSSSCPSEIRKEANRFRVSVPTLVKLPPT